MVGRMDRETLGSILLSMPLCVNEWLYLVMYGPSGHVWSGVVMYSLYGHVWPWVVIYGQIRFCMAMNGHAWSFVVVWSFVVMYAQVYLCLVMYGQVMHGPYGHV